MTIASLPMIVVTMLPKQGNRVVAVSDDRILNPGIELRRSIQLWIQNMTC